MHNIPYSYSYLLFVIFQAYQDSQTAFKADLLKQKPAKNKGNDGVEFDQTRDKVRASGERYSNLQGQTKDLMAKLDDIQKEEKEFSADLDKMLTWMSDAQQRTNDLRDEPLASEPVELQKQLESLKDSKMDVFSKAKNLDDLKKAQVALVDNLRQVGADEGYIQDLEDRVKTLDDQHEFVVAELTAKDNVLHTALVQSQGIQEGIDGLLKWIDGAEKSLNQMQAISLVPATLNEQQQEMNVLKTGM